MDRDIDAGWTMADSTTLVVARMRFSLRPVTRVAQQGDGLGFMSR
jgi:hypothetical protein